MLLAILFTTLLLVGQNASAAPPLTLKEAIALAQRASPAHAGAAAVLGGATDAASAAGRLLNPLLDIRTENWTPSSTHSLPLDIWATVSQPFELGGKRDLRRGVAAAARDGAAADLAATDRRIALETARYYLLALRARTLVDSLTSNRDGLSTVVQTLRARVGEGYVAEADQLRVEAEAARLDIDIARATLDLARSLDTLTAAVGAIQPIEAAQLLTPAFPSPPTADAAAIAAAVAHQPELAAASARVARAERAQALEQAKRLPDPAITTGFKRTLGIGTMVAAVTTTIPLFDRNGVAIATSTADARAAAAERDRQRLKLTADATSLVRAAQALSSRAASAGEDLLAPAEVVREAARSAFREGSVDVLKLIDAERIYGEVRRVAIDLQLEAIASTIEARVALGEEPLP
jgi:cobalt-zinc-cadmium efflux system outer membrane protein